MLSRNQTTKGNFENKRLAKTQYMSHRVVGIEEENNRATAAFGTTKRSATTAAFGMMSRSYDDNLARKSIYPHAGSAGIYQVSGKSSHKSVGT